MSINNKAIFEERLELLIKEVNLAYEYNELYAHIKNYWINNKEILNIAPGFFQLVLHSFQYTTFIILAKVYEKPTKTEYSLPKLIDFVEKNLEIFPTEYIRHVRFSDQPELDYEDKIDKRFEVKSKIPEHYRSLEEKKNLIKNLRGWRDKLFAHNDKHALSPDLLGKDFPLKFGDIQELLLLAMKIVNDYSVGYNGVEHSIYRTNYKDIDNIFEILEKYKRLTSSPV